MKVSYHNHTNYSDGVDTPEAMLEEAARAGYTQFAITDHVYSEDYPEGTLLPNEYPIYVEHLKRLREEHKPNMEVIIGIEADWYLNEGTFTSCYEEIKPMIDFTVGSVHVLRKNHVNYLIDGSFEWYVECLQQGFGGDIEKMVMDYFESYLEMATTLKPDLLGHIDIIRINNKENRFFRVDEPWMIRAQEMLAKEIAKLDLVTEVNGGGAYRYNNGIVYPSDVFLQILKENNVKMTVGLDSHKTDMVDHYYISSVNLLKRAGYQQLQYRENGSWKAADIENFCG